MIVFYIIGATVVALLVAYGAASIIDRVQLRKSRTLNKIKQKLED
jgi:hypothetical protein